MGYSLSKADELYCSGEKEKAIEILEKFVSNRDISKITRKTIRAYESMAVYKYQMGKDYSKEIAVLSEMDNDDLFGFTFFLMGLHYESIGDKQKAFEKFKFYVERVNDAEQFADSFEAKDDWLRVEKEYFKKAKKHSTMIYIQSVVTARILMCSQKRKKSLFFAKTLSRK